MYILYGICTTSNQARTNSALVSPMIFVSYSNAHAKNEEQQQQQYY